MRRLILSLAIALVMLIAAAGSAHAATPFTAGTAVAGSPGNPDLAVGVDGVGHVAWMNGGANVQVGYCRVAPGGSACDEAQLLNFDAATAANQAGRAAVFSPAPNKVVIVATCWNCGSGPTEVTHRWISTDNGNSFFRSQIGDEFATSGAGALIDESDVFVASRAGSIRASGGGVYESGPGVPYATGGIFSYGAQVVRLPGTSTLVAAVNDLAVVKYGVYMGPTLAQGAINTAANWNKDVTLSAAEVSNKETALNSGPNGVFLSYLSTVPGSTQVGLRHFDPASGTFGPPIYMQGTELVDVGYLSEPDSSQDGAGRLHVVWRSLYDGGRLRYRASDPSGTSFGPIGNLAVKETFTDPQVAAGPAGTGFVVWKGSADAVRVVPIDPQPEPVAGGPGTPGGPVAAGPVPRVSRATIGDRTLRPGQGTAFTFISSKAGRAVLTIEKQFKGLKVKRKVKTKSGKRKVRRACVAKTKKRLRALRRKAKSARAYRKALRKQSCRGFRRIGKISRQVRVGRNTIRFNGRVAGRKLGKGVYRAKLVITDSAGQQSRAEVLRFKVVGKPQHKARGKRGSGHRR